MKMKSVYLTISVLLNIALGFLLFIKGLDGCAEISDGRLGVLSKDTQAGIWGTNQLVLTLPKGLVVQDASATGMDRFEPHRFKIIVTSDNEKLVDYTVDTKANNPRDALYSADVKIP